MVVIKKKPAFLSEIFWKYFLRIIEESRDLERGPRLPLKLVVALGNVKDSSTWN